MAICRRVACVAAITRLRGLGSGGREIWDGVHFLDGVRDDVHVRPLRHRELRGIAAITRFTLIVLLDQCRTGDAEQSGWIRQDSPQRLISSATCLSEFVEQTRRK
jgi:hypothetical protein